MPVKDVSGEIFWEKVFLSMPTHGFMIFFQYFPCLLTLYPARPHAPPPAINNDRSLRAEFTAYQPNPLQ